MSIIFEECPYPDVGLDDYLLVATLQCKLKKIIKTDKKSVTAIAKFKDNKIQIRLLLATVTVFYRLRKVWKIDGQI